MSRYPYPVNCPYGIEWTDHQMMSLPPGWYIVLGPKFRGIIPDVEGPMTEDETTAYMQQYRKDHM